MTRIGYAILCAVILALAGYVFWPEKAEGDSIERLWSGGTNYPTRYQVRLGELQQAVEVPQVTVQGIKRALDAEAHERLWSRIRILGATADRVVRNIGPEQLAAYGITETRRVTCDAIVLGWARSAQGGYVWEGRSRRLLAVDGETVEALDQAAGRLDDRSLIDAALRCTTVVVGGVTVAKDSDGRWRDQANPFRPAFNQRIGTLLRLAHEGRLERFGEQLPMDAVQVGEVVLAGKGGAAQRIVVLTQRDRGWLRVGDLPPQRLDAPGLAEWTMCFDDLRSDMLFDIEQRVIDSPLVEVQVSRAGRRVFRLEKHGVNDVDRDGSSRWDVVWDGGRETASGAAAALLAQACDRLRVTQVALRGVATEPADAISIEFVFSAKRDRLRVVLVPRDGGSRWEVWSDSHRGRAESVPRLLSEPSADDCLDTALSTRPALRVAKVQRQSFDQTGADEVFVSDKGVGAWRCSFPAARAQRPVNQLAVDRLVRSLCTARGRSTRLLRPEDRAIIASPIFSLALRFVPVVERRSEDGIRLGDTTDQDWLVAFGRTPEGWRAVDGDGGVSWLLSDELVDLLRQPLGDDLVFPIIASMVRRIELAGPQGRCRLTESNGRWTMTVTATAGGTLSRPADAVEVRRYLRTLANLRAVRRGGAGPIPAAQTVGSVVCELPDVGDEKAQAVLTIGRAAGDVVPVAAITSRDDQHLGNDLMLVSAADASALLPAPSVFAAAEAQP